jgi:hypothetical protein
MFLYFSNDRFRIGVYNGVLCNVNLGATKCGGGGVLETLRNYLLKIQSVPRSKHFRLLMLYREIIAVCSQIQTKHINTLCGQNVELLNVKLAVHIVTTGL